MDQNVTPMVPWETTYSSHLHNTLPPFNVGDTGIFQQARLHGSTGLAGTAVRAPPLVGLTRAAIFFRDTYQAISQFYHLERVPTGPPSGGL